MICDVYMFIIPFCVRYVNAKFTYIMTLRKQRRKIIKFSLK